MTKLNITIPIFKYDLTIISLSKSDKFDKLKRHLKAVNLDPQTIDEIKDNMEHKYVDGGITAWHANMHRILILIYPQSSKRQKINTFNHEIRHAVDDIIEHLSIEDSETPAYLTGYLSEFILDI